MVDRLTKYSYFVLCNETINAKQLGCLVLDRLVRYYGVPTTFITDRDKLFTSRYQKTLVSAIGIKHNLLTAFYLQTDRQTERSNQTLEGYLRHYVNYAQNNQVALLPLAQVALNNNMSETTKISPFFRNFGKDLNLFITLQLGPEADRAITDVTQFKKIYEEVRAGILHQQESLTKTRHKDSKTAPQLKEGDKVFLLTKNLKTRRKTKKLDHVKVGPFLISDIKGPNNYRLELLKDAMVHLVFYISMLEPADSEILLQTTFYFELQEDDVFEVEEIRDWDGN